MKHDACKICGGTALKPYYQQVEGFGTDQRYDLYQCQQCQTVFTYPYLTRKELDDYFDTQELIINGVSDEHFIDQYLASKEAYWQSFGYMARLDQIRQFAPKAKTLLDVGCGAGFFLDCCRDHGYTVQGLEISRWGHEMATKRLQLDVRKQPLSKLDLATCPRFDVITMFDVLEHSDDPSRDLSIVKQLLNKNGILIVNLPNIDSYMSKSIGKHWNKLIPPNHTFFFSPKTLEQAVTQQGFKVKLLTTNNGNPNEITAELAASLWLLPAKVFPSFGEAFDHKAEPVQSGMTWQRFLVKVTHSGFYRLGFLAKPFLPRLIDQNLGEGVRIVATPKA